MAHSARRRHSVVSSGVLGDRRGRGKVLAMLEPDEMREYLLAAPLSKGGRLWCDRILQGVDRGERTCLRLYAEALRWVGGQGNLMLVFMQSFGARSEDELKELVDSGRRFKQLTAPEAQSLEHYRDEATELLRLVLIQRPEWSSQVLGRLGVQMVETNGDGG